jgi:hypothetical protein
MEVGMTDIAMTLPAHLHLRAGALCLSVLKAVAKSFQRSKRCSASEIATFLTDELRADLAFENPPLRPVSRFQGFEIETYIAKQSPEALQFQLTRGIER